MNHFLIPGMCAHYSYQLEQQNITVPATKMVGFIFKRFFKELCTIIINLSLFRGELPFLHCYKDAQQVPYRAWHLVALRIALPKG